MIADFIASHAWTIYLLVFLAPFVQEDAAIVGAATAAVTQQGDPTGLFAATLLGLTLSDSWKYWAGAFAHKWPPAARWVANPQVAAAKEGVLRRLGVTLIAARFVPGTRIPLYLACGLFKAPFERFLPMIVLSGALYLGLTFSAFMLLGAVAGEHVRAAAPFVVVAIVIVVIGINVVGALRKRQAKIEQ